MKYIHTLTGLRGLAALIVFISHSANESMLPAALGLGFGQVGVMIFFVLSGFLISHLYVKEDFNSENVKRYFFARVARIFPLYLLLLFLSLLISQYIYPEFFYHFSGFPEFLRSLLFINAPFAFWTIPVEVQFYITFLGFWYLYKKYANPYVLALFIVITLIPSFLIYLKFQETPNIVSLYSYAFYIGVITALIQKKIRDNKLVIKVASIAGYPLIFFIFVNLPILRQEFGLIYSEYFYFRTWGDPIIWVSVYSLFICAVVDSKSLSFLKTKFFIYLGKISYGFYLMHYPVIMCFKGLEISPLSQCISAFIVTITIAHISYHYFERPVGRLIRNYPTAKQALRAQSEKS